MENALTDSLCATAGAGDAAPEAVAWYARALGHDMLQRAYVPGPQKAVSRIQKCGGAAAGHAYFRAI
jgi:hypothetical protein